MTLFPHHQNGGTFDLRILLGRKSAVNFRREVIDVADNLKIISRHGVALLLKDIAKEDLNSEERKQYRETENILFALDDMLVLWSKVETLLDKKKDL